jgi:hypothetical protein
LAFIVLPLSYQALQFLDALDHIEHLDSLHGVVEDAQRGPDFAAHLPASQVALQGIDRLARGLLQPADSGFHDAAPGQTVSGLKFGKGQPAVYGCLANAGPGRGRRARRLSQQGCDQGLGDFGAAARAADQGASGRNDGECSSALFNWSGV